MPTLADVLREINRMRDDGVVVNYAIGGATAVLFYAEPTRTFDVDVFVQLAETGDGLTSFDRVTYPVIPETRSGISNWRSEIGSDSADTPHAVLWLRGRARRLP